MVDGAPPGEGCEVFDGKMNDEEWDRNDNENVADSNDTHNVL